MSLTMMFDMRLEIYLVRRMRLGSRWAAVVVLLWADLDQGEAVEEVLE